MSVYLLVLNNISGCRPVGIDRTYRRLGTLYLDADGSRNPLVGERSGGKFVSEAWTTTHKQFLVPQP